MPRPAAGETQQEYVSRFMASEEARRDYPDEKQRAAVAYSMWRERKNSRPAKRKTTFQGLPINIEIEAGDIKNGVDDRGEAWTRKYRDPYGEIARTEGDDGDPVDVYLGKDESSQLVFVVHQVHRDGTHDEDKVFLGFNSAGEAGDSYFLHGPFWGFGTMDVMTIDEFKKGYLAATRPKTNAPPGPAFMTQTAGAEEGKARYGTL